jgi:biopolymer transport protein ExbD
MAISVGATTLTNDPDVLVDINTTPLIDVMLVLLIMLIITIPVQLHAITLNMPVGSPPPPLVKPEVVRIDIDAAGTIRWNGEVVAGPAELDARLTAAAAQPLQPELHVRPERSVAYKTVAGVMAAVQRKRLTKVGIVGNEQFI